MLTQNSPILFTLGTAVTLAHVPGSPVMTVRHRREFAHRSWYDVTWHDSHGECREGTFAEDDLKAVEKPKFSAYA